MKKLDYYKKFPDIHGKFGEFGGLFVPETLIPAVEELIEAYNTIAQSKEFKESFQEIQTNYMGRPTPLTFARRLSEKYGCKIYLKREDLLHGGAHKLNNVMGQALLAKMMGKTKIIAETGAGQHGFATAVAGAYFGMEVKIFMGAVDIERQLYNVHRMKMLGATVVPVITGSQTLKAAINAGLQYWISHLEDSHYLMGTVAGPHPYPQMVRDFQSIISEEIKSQILEKENRLPNSIIACVGGGSNAMGAFYNFIEDTDVELWAIEAAGKGKDTNEHALALGKGIEGILHGAQQFLIQDSERNIEDSYSISAGLDYPGVGPELCYLKTINRLKIDGISDQEALEACIELCRTEGIIPALESSHAVAYAFKLAKEKTKDDIIIINLSGHGGKDVQTIIKQMNEGRI